MTTITVILARRIPVQVYYYECLKCGASLCDQPERRELGCCRACKPDKWTRSQEQIEAWKREIAAGTLPKQIAAREMIPESTVRHYVGSVRLLRGQQLILEDPSSN